MLPPFLNNRQPLAHRCTLPYTSCTHHSTLRSGPRVFVPVRFAVARSRLASARIALAFVAVHPSLPRPCPLVLVLVAAIPSQLLILNTSEWHHRLGLWCVTCLELVSFSGDLIDDELRKVFDRLVFDMIIGVDWEMCTKMLTKRG